jgi:hypothetical protein
MAKQDIQIPGAPVEAEAGTPIDPKDAEIAALRAQLAAAGGTPTTPDSIVFEPVTPHGAGYIASSEHRHLTASELNAMVRKGEVKLVDHHVLCKDGWYANPTWSANGG